MNVLLLVTKNEGDLLRLNLEHHLNNGFDVVGVADNCSDDHTQDVVRQFGSSVVTQRFTDFHVRQDVRRAMLSAIHGPRERVAWAVIADTDEFFWSDVPLTEFLSDSPPHVVAVNFDAKLYLPTALDPEAGSVLTRRRYRTTGGESPIHSSYVAGKSAYRPDWLLQRGAGHQCARHEHLCQDAAADNVRDGDLRVHHYMIQDEDQFVEKVVRLIEWARPPAGMRKSARWRLTPKRLRPLPPWSDRFKKEWWGVYQESGRSGLREYYRSTYVLSPLAVQQNLAAGALVLDDSLARFRSSKGQP